MQPLSPGRQRRILSILVVSAVLIWIDATVLGIALERLADPVTGIGASPGQLQWAVGAYSLLFATVLFAAGALGDRFGHRSILLLGLAVFGASSAWAAWATGPTALIAARAVMGAGGAMIMPTSMAIIGATFPAERRAGAIATWSASAGIGVALGPVLGGLLIDRFWWGSVFLVNLPIVVVGLVGTAVFVHNPRNPQRRRLDPVGLGLSTAGLFALAYGLIEGGQAGGWGRWQVWGSIVAGVALIAAFLLAEMRAQLPSFDPRLFRNRRFAAGNAALAAIFLTVTGQSFYTTFYLQGARGMTALAAGFLSVPGAFGVVIGAPLGARLTRRVGVAPVAGTAMLVFTACHAANLTYGMHTPLWRFCVVGALAGTAIGAAVAPTTAAVIGVLPMDRMGAGSAVNNTIRQVGSVLGVAVLGTVLANAYQRAIAPSLSGLPPATRAAAGQSAEATRRVASAVGRPDLVGTANHAFIHAMHITAGCAAACTLIGAAILIAAFANRRPAAGDVAPVAADAPVPADAAVAADAAVPADSAAGIAVGDPA
ncbi:MFS transporter [Rugosimonospora africana]|uniref:MFS transporter n=1 Tax=Rugosimonospora africana TaxID=556532 RepID=A0A8J3QRP0_9ACTN|nr:MFS transporter [Rugosimonospora africana]GIH15569.1 MFS transporter [Rugosimonospora africana]